MALIKVVKAHRPQIHTSESRSCITRIKPTAFYLFRHRIQLFFNLYNRHIKIFQLRIEQFKLEWPSPELGQIQLGTRRKVHSTSILQMVGVSWFHGKTWASSWVKRHWYNMWDSDFLGTRELTFLHGTRHCLALWASLKIANEWSLWGILGNLLHFFHLAF